MKRFLKSLAVGILLALPWVGDVSAQQVNNYWCSSATIPCPPSAWTPTSAANPFPITGALSIAGTTSNASSGVATSSTNLPTVSYNYGFNGTTWDQLQVDGSKNLKVNVVAGGAGGGAVFGPTADGSPAANPPVIVGGTIDGTATGNVGNWKVNAAGTGFIDAVVGGGLLNAINAAVPCFNATAFNTNSYSNAGTNPLNCDLNGNLYTNSKIAGNVTVIGPTADGSAASTAPVLVAGTTDGTATGLVAVPKVSAGGLVSTDGSAVTQPVSAASLPLPSGAATAALQGTDPCVSGAKTSIPISITTATTTNILAGTAAVKTYVCHLLLTSAAADNVAVIQGTTGGTCGSGTLGLVGGVTAANGLNFAANGGVNFGNGGAQVLQTTVNNNDICLITSAATPLAGTMTYVKQ